MNYRTTISLLAFATLVVASATLFSSSALTSPSLEREATVEVAVDKGARIGLVDGHPSSGLVEQADDGTLEVDFTLGGAAGPNEKALFTLGSPDSPDSSHAFRLVNNGARDREVVAAYALAEDATDNDDAANLEFAFYHDAGSDGSYDFVGTATEVDGDDGVVIAGVAPGDTVYVVVTLDVRETTVLGDLSGRLSITVAGV